MAQNIMQHISTKIANIIPPEISSLRVNPKITDLTSFTLISSKGRA